MPQKSVDVAIIGAGSAGLVARREALKAGAKSVVIIEGGPHGTTCARVGCMPSKLLIQAAETSHDIDRSNLFGIEVSGKRIDGPAVLDRVRQERDRFVGFVVRAVEEQPEEQKVTGYAKFKGPNLLEIDGFGDIEAKSIIIATGSSPFIPESLMNVRQHLMVNDDVFELKDLPKSIAVLGTGVIGLELGQSLHRLGVKVKFFNRSKRVAGLTDPVVSAAAQKYFGEELEIAYPAQILGAEKVSHGLELSWQSEGKNHSEVFERILVTSGRKPNLDQLDVEKAGLKINERGNLNFNNQTMQVENSNIFMAGDITGQLPILHEASDEGRIAGINAATYPQVKDFDRRTPLAVVFSDPGIAFVGKKFSELNLKEAAIGEVSYEDQGRARVMGKNKGIVRIYGDKVSKKLIGAEMLGPRVENTGHLISWAVQKEMTVKEALSMPFYHPVVEEGIRTALKDLLKHINT